MNALSGAACRVAEGAAEILPIALVKEYGSIFNVLKARGFSVVATTPHEARSLYSVKWPNKIALLFGAEGSGLSEEVLQLADMRVAIPRLGPLESLNVGTAVASVLTEARRELVISGAIRRYSMPGS
jgi:tRNA G18 (ribose-2'-O)-methylase SpoU